MDCESRDAVADLYNLVVRVFINDELRQKEQYVESNSFNLSFTRRCNRLYDIESGGCIASWRTRRSTTC